VRVSVRVSIHMYFQTGTQDMRRLADVIPQTDWNDWGYQNAIIMWKMTLPGAAFIYYGEEIGMTSVNNTGDQGSRDPAGNISLVGIMDMSFEAKGATHFWMIECHLGTFQLTYTSETSWKIQYFVNAGIGTKYF